MKVRNGNFLPYVAPVDPATERAFDAGYALGLLSNPSQALVRDANPPL
jgi:hypothetical protein